MSFLSNFLNRTVKAVNAFRETTTEAPQEIKVEAVVETPIVVEKVTEPTPLAEEVVEEVVEPIKKIKRESTSIEPIKGAFKVDNRVEYTPERFTEFHNQHRQHQKESCDALVGETIGQIIIPTGTGKTRIQVDTHIGDMIQKTNRNEKGVYVIGAHRLLLCRQLLNDLLDEASKSGLLFDILFVGSSVVDETAIHTQYDRDHTNCNVSYTTSGYEVEQIAKSTKQHLLIVSTYQSFNRLNKIPLIDICTYDEAHTLTRDEFAENVSEVKANIKRNFFFTATRKVRGEDDGMNDEEFFGKILHSEAPRTMIDRGEIVAPKIHRIEAVRDEQGVRNRNIPMDIKVIIEGFQAHRAKIKESSANPDMLGAKLLITTTGNDQLFNIHKSEEFQSFCAENNIKVIAFSSSDDIDRGYFLNFSQCNRNKAFEHMSPYKEPTDNDKGNPSGLKDEEDAILFHIEILTEGIDLPSITGVMPFRALEKGKLFQTLGRASRLLKADRTALYAGDIQPNELSKFIKPNSWLLLPYYSSVESNNEEMESTIITIMVEYGIPEDELVIMDTYLSHTPEAPKKTTETDEFNRKDVVTELSHTYASVINSKVNLSLFVNKEHTIDSLMADLDSL